MKRFAVLLMVCYLLSCASEEESNIKAWQDTEDRMREREGFVNDSMLVVLRQQSRDYHLLIEDLKQQSYTTDTGHNTVPQLTGEEIRRLRLSLRFLLWHDSDFYPWPEVTDTTACAFYVQSAHSYEETSWYDNGDDSL